MPFRFWGKEIPESLEETDHPSRTALVVVDLQNDFAHPDGYFGKGGGNARGTAVLEPNRRLIEGARRLSIPIVYTQKIRRPDGSTDTAPFLAKSLQRGDGAEPLYCLQDTWGAKICDAVAPKPEDILVSKYHRSGFTGSDLDFILRERGVKTVVVTGLTLSGCVEGTLRGAYELGYFGVVPKDCVADYDPAAHERGLQWIEHMLLRDHLTTSDRLLEVWSATGSAESEAAPTRRAGAQQRG